MLTPHARTPAGCDESDTSHGFVITSFNRALPPSVLPPHARAPAGCDESDISQGFVISSFNQPVPMVTQFEAQLMIVELLEHNPIFTGGWRGM